MLERMKELVNERGTCVLATAAGGKPHCSLMAYVSDPDCREIYMVTHRETVKYKNLANNPSVSLLIDTREGRAGDSQTMALTVEGLCTPITDKAKRSSVTAMLLERHPHLRVFLDEPNAALLSVEITSLLLLDGLTEAHYHEL